MGGDTIQPTTVGVAVRWECAERGSGVHSQLGPPRQERPVHRGLVGPAEDFELSRRLGNGRPLKDLKGGKGQAGALGAVTHPIKQPEGEAIRA